MLAKVISKKDLGNCFQYVLRFNQQGQEKQDVLISSYSDLQDRGDLRVYYLGDRLTLLKTKESKPMASAYKNFEWTVSRSSMQFNPARGSGKQEIVIPMQDNLYVKVVDWGAQDSKGVFQYACDVLNNTQLEYVRLKFYWNTEKGAIKAKRQGDRDTRDILTAGVSVDHYQGNGVVPYVPQPSSAEEYAAQMQGGGLYAILGLAGGGVAAPAQAAPVAAPAQTVVNVPPRGDRQPSPNMPVPTTVAPAPVAQVAPAPVQAAPTPVAQPNPVATTPGDAPDLTAQRAGIVTDYMIAALSQLSVKSGLPVAELCKLDNLLANMHGAGSYVANDVLGHH